MNSLRYYFFLPFLLILFSVESLNGQQNDFQFWPSAKLSLEIVKNLKFHVEEEVRFRENVSQLSRQINDLGFSYRINKYLKGGIFYRLEADWKNVDNYSWRNGIYGDLSVKYDPGRFILGYRLRIQSLKVETTDREASVFDGFKHRHKVTLEYNIKGLPLSPFIEDELFVNYSSKDKSMISAFRTWIGVDYTLHKIHMISLRYGIDQELNTIDPLRSYIISLGYSLDISLLSVN